MPLTVAMFSDYQFCLARKDPTHSFLQFSLDGQPTQLTAEYICGAQEKKIPYTSE